MQFHRRWGVFFLGVCVLGLTSCVDSDNPLSDPQQAKPATDLAGVWRVNTDEGTRYYHVGLAGDKFPAGVMQMTMVDHKKDGTTQSLDRFYFFTTTLGDRHFANITTLEPDQLDKVNEAGWKPETFKGYWLYEYQLKDGKIHLLQIDWDQKKSLIEDKKIAGVIEKAKGWGGDDIRFTESSERLAKFVTSPEAEKLFHPAERNDLERVR
jgi:hypothetical protein